MIVNMATKTYDMSENQYKIFLNVAKKCLESGIYAIENEDKGIAIMLNKKAKSKEDLEEQMEEYERNGFKVYYNWIWFIFKKHRICFWGWCENIGEEKWMMK